MDANKNTLIRTASILMAVCALVAIIFGLLNTFSFTGSMSSLSAEESAMIESQLSGTGVSVDQAMGIAAGAIYFVVAITVVFNIMKIIVGIVGFKKAEKGTTYFIAWGIVLLVFGVLSGIGGFFSLSGICNLLGGIAAPILFIIGGAQNKKALS